MKDNVFRPVKVLFVGFSVTEDKGSYLPVLELLIENKKLPLAIRHLAIGGATVQILPFLLQNAPLEDYDYVAFEITTSRRFFDSRAAYIRLFDELIFQCRTRNVYPLFVNMFRDDIDYASDIFLPTLTEYAQQRNIPTLDLVTFLNEMQDTPERKEILRDGVHTTVHGAKVYASKISRFLMKQAEHRVQWDQPKLVLANDLLPVPGDNRYSRGNLDLPFVTIAENETVEFTFPEPTLVCGLLFQITPKGGAVMIAADNGSAAQRVTMYDDTAYYRRYSYKLMPEITASRIRITSLPGRPNIKLRKGQVDDGPRENYVTGFFTNSHVSKTFRK